jgi:hypothetical protein
MPVLTSLALQQQWKSVAVPTATRSQRCCWPQAGSNPPEDALLDFRLYLPKSWCADRERRERAQVPADVEFTTKPALGAGMITGAGVPFAWVAAR